MSYYKLPVSSEEILDPHNLFLEVWATAGFGAVLALLVALVLGLRNLLGPPSGPDAKRSAGSGKAGPVAASPRAELAASRADEDEDEDGDGPPRQVLWLLASAGAGGSSCWSWG